MGTPITGSFSNAALYLVGYVLFCFWWLSTRKNGYFGEVANVFGIESYLQSVARCFGFGVKDDTRYAFSKMCAG